jgi:hypothetical protein
MKVYSPQPNNELFKVTNLKAFTTKRLTKSHPMWDVLDKIATHLKINDEPLTKIYGHIYFNESGGGFNEQDQTLYVYVAGDSEVSITKSLTTFSEGYQSKSGWGIKKWNEIKP